MKMKKRPDGHAIMANLTLDNSGVEKLFNVVEPTNEGGATDLYIYDIIDQFWGVSATMVIEALQNVQKGSPLNVRLNSPGGSVFEARAILSALRNHGKFNTYVDGIAASAASWIATAGNSVTMSKGSFLMIHQSWGAAYGNAQEMRATADLLDKIDGTIIDDYAARTGQDRKQLTQWLQDETWFTADEAKEANFADLVDDGKEADNKWNMTKAYKNAPEPKPVPEDEFDWELHNRRAAALMIGIQ